MNQNELPKVFVIEDDMFLGRLLNDQLHNAPIEPKLFTSAEDAIEAMKTTVPALIILDIFLPHMNGLDALELIRKDERTKNIPVLVVSNTDDAEHRDKAVALGAHFMIKATSSPDEIIAKVLENLPH